MVPPGRPIVSDCGSETYHTTEYTDFYLNPISMKHDSFVKDTYNFIRRNKKFKIAQEFFFFSMDVDSLYTNIPIEAGIECVKKAFLKYPVLDEKFYLQIKGTAMGKRFAPAYANLYIAN